MNLFLKSFSAVLLVIFAASCTYQGNNSNPINRKFSWFSYINGDDIRKVCADLGTDRYRFVYNGIYEEQTRTYDVFFYSRQLKMQVRGKPNLREFTANDLFSMWRGVENTVQLTEADLSNLKAAVAHDIALQPYPLAMRASWLDFYWTISACIDGEFKFNAYKWPSQRWDALQFDDLLFNWDNTGVSLANPRYLTPSDAYDIKSRSNEFTITIDQNGLRGF